MADLLQTTQANLLQPDYPELQQLNRQQAFAQNLMNTGLQGQPQGQMVSGYYVKPSITQALNPLVQALTGAYLGNRAEKKGQELAAALRGKQQEAVQNYMNALNPTQTELAGPTPTGAPLQTVNTPDYGAAFKAATSPYAPAQLQAVGYEMLKPKTLKKGEIETALDFGTGQRRTIGQGMPELPAGLESAQVALGLPPNPQDWTPAQRQQASQYEFMLKNASANRQYTNIQNALPFGQKLQEDMAGALVKNYDTLKNAPTEINNLNKVAALAPKSFTGSFAQQKLDITKFFNNNLGTNVNGEKVANTEELGSRLFQSTMENLKKMDASPSQYQQQVMQQAFGTIGTDPKAIPKIVNVYKEILQGKVQEHNQRVAETEANGIKYPHSIKITMPKNVESIENDNSLDGQLRARGLIK